MKLTIESTSVLTHLNGVPVRLWRGTTEQGQPLDVFVHRIGVPAGTDAGQAETELREMAAPGSGTEALAAWQLPEPARRMLASALLNTAIGAFRTGMAPPDIITDSVELLRQIGLAEEASWIADQAEPLMARGST